MSVGILLEVNWHRIGRQLTSDWESIGIRLDVNWHLIGSELEFDLHRIWSQKRIGSQLALDNVVLVP